MIGLARGIVKLLPYNYQWKELYREEEKLLYSIVGEYAVDIQHVGSTSIEGLSSKPIIDIALGVNSLEDIEKLRTLLEGEGYQFRDNGGIKGRVLFAKGSEELRTHYLHVEVFNSDLWKNHVYFRDYLLLNRDLIEEYSQLKKDLTLKFGEDRESYTKGKNEFITAVLKKASEEFSRKKV
jgi:GrpB-like predicted nucleotidyltransferase (UPF0157 family)